MALIHCPECGKEISDKVKACPHCGYPFESSVYTENDAQKVEITSVNIQPRNPQKTKKVLSIISVLVILIAVGILAFNLYSANQEKQEFNAYIDNLSLLRVFMLAGASDSETLLNLTAGVWHDSIFEEANLETKEYTMDKGVYFYKDFNIALGNLFADPQTIDTISSIETNQDQVEGIMKELQDPPKGLEKIYDIVTELYSAYQGLTDLAINPSGSLQTFGKIKNEKADKFLEIYKKLELQIPEKR